MHNDPDELLTVGEVARVIKHKERTVYYLINKGRLRSVKIGGGLRVRRQEAEAFFKANRGQPLDRNAPVPEDAMDIEQTAKWLKYNIEYTRQLARRGVIPSHKTAGGRYFFYRDEILDAFEEAS